MISTAKAQNPGLVISEFFINPSGNDNNLEWVELIATKDIDFTLTPYTVVCNNNGTATANGWIAGGGLSYCFQINTGSVTTGQVVYVGGNGMAPTGTKIRIIDVTSTAGDGFGNAGGTAGVFGNGGANGDGIAVFNLPVASITSSTVPVDAIFYGTGIGTAFVSTTTGYELPINDLYTGGKLQTTSFFTGDPGANTAKATGVYNTASSSWTTGRSWTSQAFVNDNASSISLSTPPPTPGTATITPNIQTVSETAGTATVNVTFTGSNALPAKVIIETSVHSDASFGADYSWTNDTLTIPASTNGTFPFSISINNDLLSERTEHLIVKLRSVSNSTIGTANYQIIYITDNDYQAPVGNNELKLNALTSFSNGTEGTNSAEIVAHDPTTDRLYIVNSIGGKMDIVDFSNPAAPSIITTIPMAPYGNINSLTVHNGLVAAAIENSNPQANGSVVFFDQNGAFINQVTVGAMPDMITFNKDFTKVITACEGEPKTDYSVDPEGAIAIVDLTLGAASITNANVSIANFQAYNGQEATLRSQGIRIFGPGSSAAQDFEPEYITVSDDNTTAFVTLQENNAMAVVNLQTATVTALRPLGTQDYRNGNGLDPSDQSSGIFIGSAPVKGLFMPDAMAHATINGTEYLFTANEGDAREYTAYSEITRLSGATLDASIPDQNILKNNQFLGRLNITKASGDTDNDGDIDDIHTFSTRSFAIWNAQTGALVFDSKDLLENITATHPAAAGIFNASNSSGTAVSKNRSDDKGPEVEGVAFAVINGNNYLFASMERVGGVMIFNVDNPALPSFVGYYNNRTAATNGPDRGAEGIIIIKKEDSPTNKDIVILANEISSTLSIFEVNTCVDLAGASFTASDDSTCAGNSITLTAPGAANSTYQWFRNNTAIGGQTGTTLNVTQSGNYQLFVSNSAHACADTTTKTTITVLPTPVVVADLDQSVCQGTSVTLSATGAQNYNWNNGIQQDVAFTPIATATYTVTGTNVYGCQGQDQVTVTVNNLPIAQSNPDFEICEGETTTLSATGAILVEWDNSVDNNTPFTPLTTATYTAIITDVNGCKDTTATTITVNSLPTVDAGMDLSVCIGDSITLNASGADNYNWSNAVTNGSSFAPETSIVITVVGTDVNGCSDDDQLSINVNALPTVFAGDDVEVCEGTLITLNATGASDLNWSNGQTNNTSAALSSGIYTVTGTDANGCSDTDELEVLVNATPIVDLGNDSTTCSNYGAIVLNAGSGFTNYDWNTNATTQTINAFITGTYEVTVTDSHGCVGSDAVQLVFDPCLGIEEEEATVTVYPNPTRDNITIETAATNFEYQIVDVNGGLVKQGKIDDGSVTVDFSSLSQGVYVLKIVGNGKEIIERIVKN